MTLAMRPYLTTGKLSLPEVLTFAKAVGFDAVEFSMPDYEGFSAPEVKRMLDCNGLKASCVNRIHELASKDDSLVMEGIRGAKKMVDDAEQMGAPVIMIVPTREFFTMEYNYKHVAFNRIAAAFREVIDYARPKGIIVSFEDFPSIRVPFCSVEEVLILLKTVDGLKLTFDNGNFYPAGDDMLDAYRQLWPYVVNVHMKEWEISEHRTDILCADGKYLKGGLHGKGLLKHGELFNALKDNAYDGYIGFEYEGDLDRDYAVREGLAYLKSVS